MNRDEIYRVAREMVPEATSVQIVTNTDADAAEGDAPHHLEVWVDDEVAWSSLYDSDRESDDVATVRIRSELQDFVAESRFGWGQLRT